MSNRRPSIKNIGYEDFMAKQAGVVQKGAPAGRVQIVHGERHKSLSMESIDMDDQMQVQMQSVEKTISQSPSIKTKSPRVSLK